MLYKKIAFVFSKKDVASQNIKSAFINSNEFIETNDKFDNNNVFKHKKKDFFLFELNSLHLFSGEKLDFLDEKFNFDFFC